MNKSHPTYFKTIRSLRTQILFLISILVIHGGERSQECLWIPKFVNSRTEFMDMPIPLIKENHIGGHPTHKNIVTT